MSQEQQAIEFAKVAHGSQVRKYTGLPYVTHTQAVATIVKMVTSDQSMIVAAHCHDVAEDTDTSLDEIRNMFGDGVANLVEMVTDVSKPSDGNRNVRKAMDRAHLAAASPAGKTIKLADLIDNTRDIAINDPDFARVYIREKMRLLPLLDQGEPYLWKVANDLATHYNAVFETQDRMRRAFELSMKVSIPEFVLPWESKQKDEET